MDQIHIDGIQRTEEDILECAVRDIFCAKDFQHVLLETHKVIAPFLLLIMHQSAYEDVLTYYIDIGSHHL